MQGEGWGGGLETEFDQVTWMCQNGHSHSDCGLIRKVGVSKDLEGPSTILDLRLRPLTENQRASPDLTSQV